MKINRIYWKLFFSFWCANLIIIVATTFFAMRSLVHQHVNERQIAKIENSAKRIIDRIQWEDSLDAEGSLVGEGSLRAEGSLVTEGSLSAEGSLNAEGSLRAEGSTIKSDRVKFKDKPWRKHGSFKMMGKRMAKKLGKKHLLPPLKIFRSGELIFSHRDEAFEPDAPVMSLALADMPEYQIESIKQPPPPFLIEAIKRLNALQVVLALIASALFSSLISWSITRPIHSLRRFSSAYSVDDNARVDEKLALRGDELGELARAMDDMSKELQKKNNAQKQLLHDVSHELRAPLARLQAAAALIEQSGSSGDKVTRIHTESDRMNALIQRILDFSRLESFNEQPKVCDIGELIEDLIEDIQYEYSERQCRFEFSADSMGVDHSPVKLTLPEVLLRQALANLLQNACKYSPTNKPITVKLIEDQDSIKITVRDYGKGMTNDQLKQAIQPFYRGNESKSENGFGLGLSIVDRACKKLGGDLTLENANISLAKGEGLEATICLPKSTMKRI